MSGRTRCEWAGEVRVGEEVRKAESQILSGIPTYVCMCDGCTSYYSG